MDLSFDITTLGLISMVVVALALGVVAQMIGEVRTGYEWLLTAIGVLVGAFVASEYLGLRTFAPVWENVALIPAIVGGLVLGAVVDLVTRYTTHGSLTHSARPI